MCLGANISENECLWWGCEMLCSIDPGKSVRADDQSDKVIIVINAFLELLYHAD